MGLVLLNVMLKPPEEAVDVDTLKGSITDVFFSTVMTGGDGNAEIKSRILDLAKEFYDQGIM